MSGGNRRDGRNMFLSAVSVHDARDVGDGDEV